VRLDGTFTRQVVNTLCSAEATTQTVSIIKINRFILEHNSCHYSLHLTSEISAFILTIFLKFVGGLWAFKWAWHLAETNMSCAGISGICMPNTSILALIVSEISAFILTNRQTDMSRSTRLVILIKNICSLWGRKRFLLPLSYFPTNLVFPFTLLVTGK